MKGSRYITHLLRLSRIEKPLANFFASGILNLRDKLGPFLWQFPPQFQFQPERLDAFFRLLPRTTAQALALARRHAVEIRHPSFMTTAFVRLLREHGIGLVVADTAGKWPRMFHVTADFVYVRLHGDVKIYTSGYSGRALASWARRIRNWDRDGRDVYVYFDNDVKVKAPFDALDLMEKLGLAWHPPDATCEEPLPAVHEAGTRVPRLRYAYGPRVTGGNPAWDYLGRR